MLALRLVFIVAMLAPSTQDAESFRRRGLGGASGVVVSVESSGDDAGAIKSAAKTKAEVALRKMGVPVYPWPEPGCISVQFVLFQDPGSISGGWANVTASRIVDVRGGPKGVLASVWGVTRPLGMSVDDADPRQIRPTALAQMAVGSIAEEFANDFLAANRRP